MNRNIEALYNIGGKQQRTIIGLMSGTSFDGLDIAVCRFTGSGLDTKAEVSHFHTKEYGAFFKEEIKQVFAKQLTSLELITLLNAKIGSYFGELILSSLEEWQISPAEIDLVASHGQTIYHAPKHQHGLDGYPNATLQIGDGDHLAVKSGIITFSDFRQKHIAAGGEGAPLAIYGDYLIFSSRSESRIMLNIGGIANFTYLPAGDSSGFFSSDVGPGNTLMDQFIQANYPGQYFDKNAALGSAGVINEVLLETLFDHSFFRAGFPKTTGPELFSLQYLKEAITNSGQENISNADIMATLVAFSAKGIITAISACVSQHEKFEIYVSGGGMYNPLLVKRIEEWFGRALKSTSELGIHPDAKEAVLFALLANEAVSGGNTFYGTDPGLPAVSMGKISFPG
jgi:anhydro-N-acetylmuramic acid kinase